MSKIYQALEKAEKEREKESGRNLPPAFEPEEEKKKERQAAGINLPGAGETASNPRLVSLYQPGSLASEQFRKLRTHLFRLQLSGLPKTIMVTSATSGDGKTFVAANLAVNIATQFHVHALLVDCDLRAPQLGRWFGLHNGNGLSDYLSGDANLEGIFRKTGVEKLSLLPGGTIPGNPAELIGSKKMDALVRELETRYQDRFIIFDTTPLLATSEPEVLAKYVDGIIIVVRAGVTPRETVKQAIAPLDKEKIMGFVLNDLKFRSSGLFSRYFGSDGYYYKYGYGYGKNGSNHRGRLKKLFPFSRKPKNHV